MKKELKLYGLFDAALIPKVWFNLEAWQLNFEPLYQGNYQPIAEAIPYLIELDKSKNKDVTIELLTGKDFSSVLYISSELTLNELVKKLARFYHVRGPDNKPYLRRFFDIRLFDNFLEHLSSQAKAFLFEGNTAFYFQSIQKGQFAYKRYSFSSEGRIEFSQVAKLEEKTL
ncbi:DUF4123 domain-containing protein [Rodentibacter pneumotropicus]|uniref:DUF4123 domain-containing protein n=1 Tax=Rodentibacter pneumotropicus TaxID=758 RepID=A0A4S2QIT6_9PAST|nr:DUF4123 domain-containing protein [Rodentibacter pneumotropicus]THA00697.1 DUF4123 domain-containing protein [Rodentibacter pneumotropicus]THA01868.1 DUF4123 domain-containing protein [Rodentibacter pneumotropicus]THA05263.1 DUF4123 domain-containing protein [Rodentibacter pneumotropicus]THA17150.1 DUF4123 domain-containing protein [Rodentibacter pneumotropicus]